MNLCPRVRLPCPPLCRPFPLAHSSIDSLYRTCSFVLSGVVHYEVRFCALRHDPDVHHLCSSVSGVLTVLGLFGFSMVEGSDGGAPLARILTHGGRPRAYNAPVSYSTLKAYVNLARAATRTVQGDPADPPFFVGLDFGLGPSFTVVSSGAQLAGTGPLVKSLVEWSSLLTPRVVNGRVNLPCSVTVVDLPEMDAVSRDVYSSTVVRAPLAVPVASCAVLAMVCVFVGEWGACAGIVAGMVSQGFASVVLGGVNISFTRPSSRAASSGGSGYLEHDGDFLLLKGGGRTIASVMLRRT